MAPIPGQGGAPPDTARAGSDAMSKVAYTSDTLPAAKEKTAPADIAKALMQRFDMTAATAPECTVCVGLDLACLSERSTYRAARTLEVIPTTLSEDASERSLYLYHHIRHAGPINPSSQSGLYSE